MSGPAQFRGGGGGQDRPVCIRMGLRAVQPWSRGLIASGAKRYFLQSVKTGSESLPVSCPAGGEADIHPHLVP
jgi:hypothetical protein